LRQAGHDVRAIDLAVEEWDDGRFVWADAVAFAVPMHTAMRLALRAARRVRALVPSTPIWFYGLYAHVAGDLVAAGVADRLVAGGVRGVTCGDPDSVTVPAASARLVDGLHAGFPAVTFDCTVKVEHILRHADVWAGWAEAGCLFVVSAIESLNDDILARLDK